MSENLEKTRIEVERDELGRIKPGQQSINPNGRPKGTFSIVELLRRKIQEDMPKELSTREEKITWAERMVEVMLDKAVSKKDKDVIRDIINRIDGMPRQTVKNEFDDEVTEVEIKITKNETKA